MFNANVVTEDLYLPGIRHPRYFLWCGDTVISRGKGGETEPPWWYGFKTIASSLHSPCSEPSQLAWVTCARTTLTSLHSWRLWQLFIKQTSSLPWSLFSLIKSRVLCRHHEGGSSSSTCLANHRGPLPSTKPITAPKTVMWSWFDIPGSIHIIAVHWL